MTQKYIIFDCDGVLVDSEIIACRLEAQALTDAGYPISTEDNIRQFAGKSQQSIMSIVETALGKPLPTDFDDKLNQKILAALSQELQPIAGIKDVLEKLHHQGIEFCIASSGSMEKILNSLNVTGLNSFFAHERIFSASMVKNGKPAPDLFLGLVNFR
jgi:beta-phosphoglucomutase-like phosphatase (HAD superfamily)